MWGYKGLKDTQDPYLFGAVIKQSFTCGKQNCKCILKGEKHKGFYLRWREYDPFANTSRIRKKYLKKSEVEQVKAKLSLVKGQYIYSRLNLSQIEYAESQSPSKNPDDIFKTIYRIFRKPPYPLFPNDPLTLMVKTDRRRFRSFNIKLDGTSRKEYLRRWRQDKKRKQMGLA